MGWGSWPWSWAEIVHLLGSFWMSHDKVKLWPTNTSCLGSHRLKRLSSSSRSRKPSEAASDGDRRDPSCELRRESLTTHSPPPTAPHLVCVCLLVSQSCPTVCNPMVCSLPRSSPGKNTGVGSHSLLQGIFLTQGLNLGLLHCRQTLYHLSHQGSPPLHFRALQFPLVLNSVEKAIVNSWVVFGL